jgi:dTMP kinase
MITPNLLEYEGKRMEGKFIVFEGIEGGGKSTQLRRLADHLDHHPRFQALVAQGRIRGVRTTREPGGTPLGQVLRQLLLEQDVLGQDALGQAGVQNGPQGQPVVISAPAELLLYGADRAQHVEEVIWPALQQGYWVLCDRFIYSTIAYQGYGRGLNQSMIEQINQIATGGLVPDLILWLKLEAVVGLARTRQRGAADRMEQADLAFHQRVQQGFEGLAQRYADRIVAIEATADPLTVEQSIQTVVETCLEQWYGPVLTT